MLHRVAASSRSLEEYNIVKAKKKRSSRVERDGRIPLRRRRMKHIHTHALAESWVKKKRKGVME